MYETNHDVFQLYFGQELLQYHHIDTDVFALSINFSNIIKGFPKLIDFFDFSNLNENLESDSNKNKKIMVNSN